mmetsp:Transcript_18735/g.54572  ORF Transcript_18735/g.54572 Transcript_18735/m.54572 type:complete len:375 (-) Transcript_18735:122-1246(-)
MQTPSQASLPRSAKRTHHRRRERDRREHEAVLARHQQIKATEDRCRASYFLVQLFSLFAISCSMFANAQVIDWLFVYYTPYPSDALPPSTEDMPVGVISAIVVRSYCCVLLLTLVFTECRVDRICEQVKLFNHWLAKPLVYLFLALAGSSDTSPLNHLNLPNAASWCMLLAALVHMCIGCCCHSLLSKALASYRRRQRRKRGKASRRKQRTRAPGGGDDKSDAGSDSSMTSMSTVTGYGAMSERVGSRAGGLRSSPAGSMEDEAQWAPSLPRPQGQVWQELDREATLDLEAPGSYDQGRPQQGGPSNGAAPGVAGSFESVALSHGEEHWGPALDEDGPARGTSPSAPLQQTPDGPAESPPRVPVPRNDDPFEEE